MNRLLSLFALPFALLHALPSEAAQREAAPAGHSVIVGRAALVDGKVETSRDGKRWEPLVSGEPLRAGDRIRTGPLSLVRFQLPWSTIRLDENTRFSVAPSRVLETRLEGGRAEITADAHGMIKLITPEARVGGSGRVVVRRTASGTRVMVLAGKHDVEASRRIVPVNAGLGTLVLPGRVPQVPVGLPAAPTGLQPGVDPLYVDRDKPVTLRWTSAAAAHRLEILDLAGQEVVLGRDVTGASAEVALPWFGTYRWRVRAAGADGLESGPSEDGLLCIVER